jgi:ABC-type Fe3+/spermidine/putrescine transport system ATPase subunit
LTGVRLRLEHLRKSFGTHRALQIDALDIGAGEFFSLLGPSGCGKTTTLRCIAGTASPETGRVLIGDRDVTAVPTHRRNLGMVFQQYALFPHLTVNENVAYGLEGRGLSAAARATRVRESLQLVALAGLEDRYPHQLSGGQQQRVAVARAVAYRPDVLLLDEPFSNLDVKLRTTLRNDLKRLQQTLRLTTVFVTHDQQEALALSDRLAVMHAGRIEQVGTPREIYERPAAAFVADFVGSTNLLPATVLAVGAAGEARVQLDGGGTLEIANASGAAPGVRVTLMVKPERVHVVEPRGADALTGELTGVSYLGSSYSYVVQLDAGQLEARQATPAMIADRPAEPGDRVAIDVEAAAIRLHSS